MISSDPPHHLLPSYAQFLMAGLLLLIQAYFSYVIIQNDTQTSLNQHTIKQIKGTACTVVLWLIDRDESHKWSTTSGIAAPNTQLVPERLNLDRGSGACKTPVPVPPSTEREAVQRVTEIFSATVMGPCPLTPPRRQGTTVLLCGGTEACCPSPVPKTSFMFTVLRGFLQHFTSCFIISAHKLIDDFTELCKKVCKWVFKAE